MEHGCRQWEQHSEYSHTTHTCTQGPLLHSNLQISTGGSANHHGLTFEPIRKGKCRNRQTPRWGCYSLGLLTTELRWVTHYGAPRFTPPKMRHVIKYFNVHSSGLVMVVVRSPPELSPVISTTSAALNSDT